MIASAPRTTRRKPQKSRNQTPPAAGHPTPKLESAPSTPRTIVGAKFHPKQNILNFGTKFAQKSIYDEKTEKVSIAIEINILDLE